jgi:hypothetical protein
MAVSNPRIKLTACGTRSHGKKRRLTHAAAYPQRYAYGAVVEVNGHGTLG